MPTPFQTLHLRAFRRALRTAGRAVAFGAESWQAVISPLRPDDPRLAGGTDRLIEIVQASDDLPSPAPEQSDALVIDGRWSRIARIDHDAASCLSTILATEPLAGSASSS